MTDEILISVGGSDETCGPLEPRHGARESQCGSSPLGEKHRHSLVLAHPCCVAISTVGDVRRQQYIHAIVGGGSSQGHELYSLKDDVASGICQNLLLETVTSVPARVDQSVGGYAPTAIGRLGPRMALFLGEEGHAVGHDEAEVANVGLVGSREVDLVEDPVAERVPDPAGGAQRCSHARLGAGRPSRWNTGPSRGCVRGRVHDLRCQLAHVMIEPECREECGQRVPVDRLLHN